MSTTYETAPPEVEAERVAAEINLQPGDRYDGARIPASRFENLRFLWVVLALFGVLYLLPWCLIRLPGTERWVGSIYGAVMDYGYDTAGQNADVLLVVLAASDFLADPFYAHIQPDGVAQSTNLLADFVADALDQANGQSGPAR